MRLICFFSMIPHDPDSYIQRIQRLETLFPVKEVATLIGKNEFKKLAFIKRITKSEIERKSFIEIDDIIELKKERLINNIIELKSNDEETSLYADISKQLLDKMSAEGLSRIIRIWL